MLSLYDEPNYPRYLLLISSVSIGGALELLIVFPYESNCMAIEFAFEARNRNDTIVTNVVNFQMTPRHFDTSPYLA